MLQNKNNKQTKPTRKLRQAGNNPVQKTVLETKLNELTEVIKNLEDKRFYKLAGKPLSLLGWGFLKGLVTGMGAIIGAAALAALMVYLLGRFSILPEWLQTVLDIVENSRTI